MSSSVASVDRGVFISTLAHHALAEIRCDHDAATDVAVCNCALWASDPEPSVQVAKEAWAAHVWNEVTVYAD
jgi:hypothetical protein